MISKTMKHLRIASISIGVAILGSSLLWGCGPKEVKVEPIPPDSESSVSPSGNAPNGAVTQAESTPPETVSPSGTTNINPPKSVTLTAQQANAEINLRSRPTTESTSEGYGLVGDAVKLLRATEGDDNFTWYYVKFNESGAEGWIRGDFINTSGSTSASAKQGTTVNIDNFTTDELFAVGSGGCGMTLWPVSKPSEFIFFNGLPDTAMWMKLDGDMTQFRRTSASGPEFYGQSASQSFISENGSIEVDVNVQVGSEEGYESVNIQQGTLRLSGPAGGTTEISVAGDAGC